MCNRWALRDLRISVSGQWSLNRGRISIDATRRRIDGSKQLRCFSAPIAVKCPNGQYGSINCYKHSLGEHARTKHFAWCTQLISQDNWRTKLFCKMKFLLRNKSRTFHVFKINRKCERKSKTHHANKSIQWATRLPHLKLEKFGFTGVHTFMRC